MIVRPLLALVLLAAVPAVAQPVPVPLDEALARARAESLPVLGADAQVASAEASLAAAGDARWPSLRLSLGGGQRYGLAFDQTTGDLTQATIEALDVGVSGSYLVFDGFEGRAQRRSAEASLFGARLRSVRAGQEAAQSVLVGYLDVAAAEALGRIAAATEAAEARLLAEVEAQVAFGARPPYEVEQQRERLAAATGAVLQAAQQRDRAAARLIQVLGLDSSTGYSFPLPEADSSTVVLNVEVLVRRALEARPDLAAAAAAQRAVMADRRAARSGRLPQIALVGSVGTSYTSANDVAGLTGQFGDNRSGSLGLRISLPLLDQGTTRSRIRQAEARAAALTVEAETVRRAVVFEVQQAVTDLQALAAQATVADARLRAAEAALDAEVARYESGATTLQAVAQARSRAVEGQVERERIQIQRLVQRRLLDLVVGEGE